MTDAPPRLEQRGEEERARPPAYARARAALPYLAALAATAYVCRGPLTGRLFGDLGDARWTVSVHEHWFRVWQGREGLRDMVYFAPLRSTLGTSDAFLAQGQIYSLLRALGLDLVPAWNATQVAVFLVGMLGVATLSRRLLRTVPAQVGFVVLVGLAYPVVVDTPHVQLLAMLSGSWIVVGLCDVLRGRRDRRGWVLLLIGWPLLALSSWYAAVLLVLVLATIGAFSALLTPWATLRRRLARLALRTRQLVRRPPGAAPAVVAASLLLLGMTAWVYLPASRLLGRPTWLETTLYAPRLSDLVNAAGNGGGIWAPLYAKLFPPDSFTYEQARGFTPVLLVGFMVLGLVQLRRSAVSRGEPPEDPSAGWRTAVPGPRVLAGMWAACLFVLLVVLVDERDFSLYEPIFRYVPGMDSIRAPFRVQAFEYAVAFIVLLRSLEMLDAALRRRAGRRRRGVRTASAVAVTLGTLVCAVVLAEMLRPQMTSWSADAFLSPALRAQLPAVTASCDAILVPTTAGGDVLSADVDAVTIATLTGLPTPQGYGRADPLGHPGGGASPQDLAGWMRTNGFTGRVCSVTPAGVTAVSG